MKKIISIILLTYVLVALSGCAVRDGMLNNDHDYYSATPYEDLYGP